MSSDADKPDDLTPPDWMDGDAPVLSDTPPEPVKPAPRKPVSKHAAIAHADAIKAIAERSYDPVSEAVCAGTVIFYPEDAYAQWAKLCTSADLYDPTLRLFVKVLEDKWNERGEAVMWDVLTFMENSGDPALRVRFWDLRRYVVANVELYAKHVALLAKQRAIAVEVERAMQHFYKASTAVEKQWALERIASLNMPAMNEAEQLESRKDMLTRIFDEQTAGTVGGKAVATGLDGLNSLLAGGFRAARLYCCAARPGVGKTSLALQSALAVCEQGRVAFVSLEMQQDDLMRRLASVISKLNAYSRPRDYREEQQMRDAYSALSEKDLHVWDKPVRKWSVVEEWLTALHLERNLSLIVVDYLQIMPGTGGKFREDQDIAENVNALKRQAKLLNCPVLLLSQLNRSAEESGRSRYKLSDLRGGGGIEQGCDVIWFLWQPPEGAAGYDDGYAELQMAKNKFGPRATQRLRWDGPTYTFCDDDRPLAYQDQEREPGWAGGGKGKK